MKARIFSGAAVLGAVGAAFCCLGPVIFSFLGVSAVASFTALRYVVPYRDIFLAVTVAALAVAYVSVLSRRRHASRLEFAILGASTLAVAVIITYAISIDGLPVLW